MRPGAKYILIASVVGIIVGSYSMYERLAYGLNPVAFGSYVPWGLWVSFYLFFLGLSAGAFLVTTLAFVFGMKRLEALAPLSAFTVLVCLLCEGLFILLDLGTVSRAFYQFFLSPNFTSLLTWMLVLFSAMGVIYALKTYLLVRGGDRGTVKLLSWISMPVGLLFYGTNGAFFAILANRPLWNSSLTPLLFIVAAILSGGALITFLSYTFLKDEGSSACIGTATCIDLGQVLKYLLVLFLALEVMQFSVGYVSAKPNLVAVLNYIAAGPSWWVFWIVHLLLGSLIPLAMLFFSGRDPKKVALAAFLIVITFVAVRYDFVVPEFSVYPLDGLQSAFVHPRLSTAYSPNLNEWLVSVWIISLGLLAFTLGVSRIPVLTQSNGGKDHE